MQTSAKVRIETPDNVTFSDAFQFGDPTDLTWTLTGQSFRMDIKGNKEDLVPKISLTSGAGQIIVDNVTLRVVHMKVQDSVLRASLVPGKYFYDFIMYDASVPPLRVALMHGTFEFTHGVTGD